jgi:hypothetical protein
VELREPQTDRMQRVLAVAVTLIVAIAVMALYLRMSERRGAPACVEAYAAARTAAETAFVDVQRSGAAAARLDAAYNVSCGELRQRGKLQ